MFSIYSDRIRPALLVASSATLLAAAPAHADLAGTCFNFIEAQDYPRAEAEARSKKLKALSREDERLIQLCLGRAQLATGRFRDALPVFERVEALSRSTEELLVAYNWLGLTLINLGNLDRAEFYNLRALKATKSMGDKSKEAIILSNLAGIAMGRDDEKQALTLYRESLAMRVTDAEKPTTLNNIALIQRSRGEYADAVRLLRQAFEIDYRQGNSHTAAQWQINLGETMRQQGDLSGAERELTAGLKAIQMVGDRHWEATAYRGLGALRFAQKRIAEAKELTRKAIEISKANGKVDEDAVSNLDFLNRQ